MPFSRLFRFSLGMYARDVTKTKKPFLKKKRTWLGLTLILLAIGLGVYFC